MMEESWQLLSASTLLKADGQGKWRRLAHFDADQSVDVEVYVSERTGLRVMLAQVPSPLLTGLVCVGAEARADPSW